MDSELLYQLALTQVPQIGDVQAKTLLQHFGSASEVFKAKKTTLEKVGNIGEVRATAIKSFEDFKPIEEEIKFIEKYKIKPLFLLDEAYPKRLLNCSDSPTLLFQKGSNDFNVSKVISIVGTRSSTEYGKQFTEKLVSDLSHLNVLVISGLAYGIDAHAHKAALKHKLLTVGVVGHGLAKIYPHAHTALAKDIIAEGGSILTEFFSTVKADPHNFPLRNRIVAGLADCTVVIESAIDGGSLITAKLADSYNRDVFAVPGRTTDKYSAGCNHLVKHNKAMLLTDAQELIEVMGWSDKKQKPKQQRQLFIELTPEEQTVIDILKKKESVHIDEINFQSGLSSSAIAAAIINMELQGIVNSLPGKMYQLL